MLQGDLVELVIYFDRQMVPKRKLFTPIFFAFDQAFWRPRATFEQFTHP